MRTENLDLVMVENQELYIKKHKMKKTEDYAHSR